MMNWTCPFCKKLQVVTRQNSCHSTVSLDVGNTKYGDCGFHYIAIACLNEDCKEIELSVQFGRCERIPNTGSYKLIDTITRYFLRPESSARPQPEYIPIAIVRDYAEACRIASLSPKASATLSRRCLQGMIRDFCGISKATLDLEIKELQKHFSNNLAPKGVTQETIDAIDHVRQIGNIGAHMERDINLIIEIDPGEAETLIGLIELLFEDWYVARFNRQQKLESLRVLADSKSAQKQLPPPSTT